MTEDNIKKVIFLCRKKGAFEAMEFLLDKNIQIAAIVTKEDEWGVSEFKEKSKEYNIPVFFDDKEVYNLIECNSEIVKNVDLVISYLFWKKIKQPLFGLGKLGCINFHPAPLPDYKSRAGYNTAILDDRPDYGVSVHYVNSEEFDAGPIIDVLSFPIDVKKENAHSLENKAQKKLVELFKKNIEKIHKGGEIVTKPNEGGLYLTSKQLEEMKRIDLINDSVGDIDRKIRAFFFPPYGGAYVERDGVKYTLVNEEILNYINNILNKK